jgi:SPP1 family predicted phage head-tail adaptor
MAVGTRKQIQLINILVTQGSDGQWSNQTESIHNTWAEVSNVNSFRDYENGQTGSGLTKRFRVRFKFDHEPLAADWKIRYQGKDYQVTGVVREDEKKFYWIMTAQTK